jgi:hypothetical protein
VQVDASARRSWNRTGRVLPPHPAPSGQKRGDAAPPLRPRPRSSAGGIWLADALGPGYLASWLAGRGPGFSFSFMRAWGARYNPDISSGQAYRLVRGARLAAAAGGANPLRGRAPQGRRQCWQAAQT